MVLDKVARGLFFLSVYSHKDLRARSDIFIAQIFFGTGFSSSINSCNYETIVSRSILVVDGSKNSPGNLMLVPYTIWVIEWFVSDVMAALKLSSTVGKVSVHLMLCAFIAPFEVLCCNSIFPLHWG
ncbi:hypothetical protein TNCV_1456761 [Trichonephila clavipes]|nr:hypothetical protein TNCV_1456761 [Trichonephila clavipes]